MIVAAILVASVPAASGATNEIRFCAKTNGFEVTAGNSPPRFPKTRCSYATAVYRKVSRRPKSLTDLPSNFSIEVRGISLGCTARLSSSYAEFRCGGPGRFVLVYKFL